MLCGFRTGLVHVMVVAATATLVVADDARALTELDEFLVKHEAIAGVFSWNFKLVPLKAKAPDFARFASLAEVLSEQHRQGLSAFVEDPEFSGNGYGNTGSVLFDCKHKRFHLQTDSVEKWVNGAAPQIGKRSRWAFDGTLYSYWTRTQHGTELPPLEVTPEQREVQSLSPALGEFDMSLPSADSFHAYLAASGACFLPPYVDLFGREPRPTSVREFVETLISRGKVLDTTTDDQMIRLSFEYPNPHPKSDVPDRIEFEFDRTRGGMLSGVKRFAAGMHLPEEEYVIEAIKWDETVWGPRRVTYVNWLNGFGSQCTFSGMQLLDELPADAFRVEMPMGTTVDDHVNKLSYVVSKGPVDEAMAIQRYVRAHELVSENSKPVPLASSGDRPWWFRPLIVANVAALVLIGSAGLLAAKKS